MSIRFRAELLSKWLSGIEGIATDISISQKTNGISFRIGNYFITRVVVPNPTAKELMASGFIPERSLNSADYVEQNFVACLN